MLLAMTDTIRTERDGVLATLTIDRPHRLNALDYATIDALLVALDAIERDDAIRAVILTGAGTRAFSAGADIHEFAGSIAAGPAVAVREFSRRGQRLTARIESFPKPVIVAVNGLAYGGGCEVTEAAPLAIACDEATFCKAEIKLGLPPTFGGTQRLPRLIGRKRAMEAILTAVPFGAQRGAARRSAFARARHRRLCAPRRVGLSGGGDARAQRHDRRRARDRSGRVCVAGRQRRSRRRHRPISRRSSAALRRGLAGC
jgi:enoyl-CoA hydratase/carnithine racemase